MASLQDSLAEFFPIEYSPDSWTDLLPKFIAHHVRLYQNRGDGHKMDLAIWQKYDQSTPAPVNPVMPPEFVEACTEQVRLYGLSLEILACTKFLAHEQVIRSKAESEEHQQQSLHDNKLCGEAIKAAMDIRKNYIVLSNANLKLQDEYEKLQKAYKAIEDRMNNNNMGQWLN